jgi:DNA-directed RNA polymerase specialized sigma24 family protein
MTVEDWLDTHFSPLRDKLFAVGLAILDDLDLAEQAVQRTALEAYRHANILDCIASPADWLRFAHITICHEIIHAA